MNQITLLIYNKKMWLTFWAFCYYDVKTASNFPLFLLQFNNVKCESEEWRSKLKWVKDTSFSNDYFSSVIEMKVHLFIFIFSCIMQPKNQNRQWPCDLLHSGDWQSSWWLLLIHLIWFPAGDAG